MDIIKAGGAILGTILSSSALTLMITHIIGYFSKKNLTKVEYARTKVNVYSHVVRFMTSLDLRNDSLEYILKTIENRLYEKYDIVAPDIIIKLAKLKAKSAKGELKEFSTKDFIKLYFSIQIEYNMAKKNVSMDYDFKYTNADSSLPIHLNYVYGVVCMVLMLIFIILGVTNTLDWESAYNISAGISILYIVIIVIIVVTYKIDVIITRNRVLKEWESIIVDKLQKQNRENATQAKSHN